MQAAETSLAYDKGRREPFRGWLDWNRSGRILLEAVAVTAVTALGVIACLGISPVVGLIAALGEGVVVGAVVRFSFYRARVRQKSFPVAVAIVCAITSALAVCLGFYVREAYSIEKIGGGSTYQHLIGLVGLGHSHHAFNLLSALSQVYTGHRGLLGYIMARGQHIKSFYPVLLTQTLVTWWLVWRISRDQISEPYCSPCADWLGTAKNAAVLPAWLSGDLASAVRSNDPGSAAEVSHRGADQRLGSSCAVARYWRCGCCRTLYVDVVVKGTKTSRGALVPPTQISEETLAALRSEPVRLVKTQPVGSTEGEPEKSSGESSE